MKQRKSHGSRFIGYDNSAPTAWYTLLLLGVFLVSFLHVTFVPTIDVGAPEAHAYDAEAEATRIEELKREANRQAFLDDLRFCESSDNSDAVGDGGASNGPYQVQKTTLEDWLDRKVSYAEYYSIVTDDARIRPLVYDAYFERGESWRWKVCTKKLTATRAWTF
jgi:hypothetical protein